MGRLTSTGYSKSQPGSHHRPAPPLFRRAHHKQALPSADADSCSCSWHSAAPGSLRPHSADGLGKKNTCRPHQSTTMLSPSRQSSRFRLCPLHEGAIRTCLDPLSCIVPTSTNYCMSLNKKAPRHALRFTAQCTSVTCDVRRRLRRLL